MKATDVKNNLLINELVKKHFSLTEKSQKLFTQRLMYERPIAKEYEEILKGSKDLRIRFDLKDDFLKEIDDSWHAFNDRFPSYVDARGLTYENFRKNKVTVNKNEKKILKDLTDFYSEEVKKWLYAVEVSKSFSILEDIGFVNAFKFFYDDFVLRFLINEINKYYDENKIDAYVENITPNSPPRSSIIIHSLNIFQKLFDKNCDYSDFSFLVRTNNNSQINFLITLADFLTTDIKKEFFIKRAEMCIVSSIADATKRHYTNAIRQKTFTDKELELVFTLNYADWFLCSTGDSWSSCISLHSTYDECYWTGIPNLIGDKSRAMVYITEKNGPKKDFYGIRTDKFIARAWVQLFRTLPNKENPDYEGYNKTFFNMIKPYPIELRGLEKLVEELIGIPTFKTTIKNYFFSTFDAEARYYKSRSRYYAENFWFKKDDRGSETMATIYLDKGSYKMAKKNKAEHFYGDYGYYSFDADGGSAFQFQRMRYNPKNITSLSQLLSSGVSFSEIIEDNSTVVKEIDRWLSGFHRDYEEDYEEDYDEDYDDEEDAV